MAVCFADPSLETEVISPRLGRYRDASACLGMDRNRFDSEVRPALIEIPIDQRRIEFDHRGLDARVDVYVAARGRPSREPKGARLCELGQEAFFGKARIGTEDAVL